LAAAGLCAALGFAMVRVALAAFGSSLASEPGSSGSTTAALVERTVRRLEGAAASSGAGRSPAPVTAPAGFVASALPRGVRALGLRAVRGFGATAVVSIAASDPFAASASGSL
jgi:hypothetical protein